MFLAVDIGNSNIVIGLHDGTEWRHKFRYDSSVIQPDVFYLHGIQEIFLEWGIHPRQISGIGLSSVVPRLTQQIESILEEITGLDVVVIDPERIMALDMDIPLPYEIGSDLVANAFAASQKFQRNCIIIDFGTALTFTVMKEGYGIIGVTFAPGINTAFRSISGNTAQLPVADIDLPQAVIGTSTHHAIQSGILYGYIGLVKELIARIQRELGTDYYVVATGGMSSQLPLEDHIDVIDKQLTLDGIRLMAAK